MRGSVACWLLLFALTVPGCHDAGTSAPTTPERAQAPTSPTPPTAPAATPDVAQVEATTDSSPAADTTTDAPAVATAEPATADPAEGESAGDADDETQIAAADAAPARPGKKAGPRYTRKADHDPNGTGKFYMGREIAQVMGFAGASWLERPEREQEEASSKMIEELGLQPGDVAADIGAGTGRLTLLLADKVGADGKVFAVDVQPEMLDTISVKLRQRNIKNVELVRGTDKSPKLKKNSIDLALFVDVYHEFAFPYEMMCEISQAMKVGGRVVLVEFRMEDETVPIKLVHKMTEAQAKKELSVPELRLKWTKTIGTLPWQHVLVFERLPDAGEEPAAEDAGTPAAAAFPETPNTQDPKDVLSTPAEALAKIALPPGFQATLFAAEPDVQQPIALTTDERGRLWVAENYTYSESKVNFTDSLRDRIVILEDTDGDGRFDERTVFWDGARKLTSVEVGFGGVWALCAPQLLFIPDANRDDIPDGPPVVVLDGWDENAVRHNIVNGLKWGPDGWLYGRHGILATSQVGAPGAAPSQRVPINTGIWRYHPTRKIFEAVAHGTTNAWGFDYDEHGEMFFINTVIGHLWHIVPGAHYRRMYGTDLNPYVYSLIEQTADHFHWDTGEAWSDIRKGVSATTDKAGGGHAHSGLMIYLGGNWPDEYRNGVFTVNLHGRRFNHDILEREGAGYVAHHAPDHIQFGDPWFRGIDLIYGPDGGVFVADWTDVGECHENDGVHRTSGRIFKLTYGQPKTVAGFDMANATDGDLVRGQTAANDWIARQARRLLQERAVAGRDLAHARALLNELLTGQAPIPHKLRAVWCLNAIGALDEARLIELLGHADEHLRAWAVRLLADRGELSPSAVAALQQQAARETAGLVLVYLASTMQRLDFDQRWPIAEAIASHAEFAGDRELPLMVWYGIEPAVVSAPDRAVKLALGSQLPIVRQHVARRLTVEIERLTAPLNSLVTQLADSPAEVQLDVLTGMSQGLKGWRKAPAPAAWSGTAEKLAASSESRVHNLARELAVVFGDGRALDELRTIIGDGNAEADSRKQALRTLIDSRPDDLPAVLTRLMGDRVLANEAIRGLATCDLADTPRLILDAFPRLDPEGKSFAINTLVSRVAFARALLEAVDAGRIARGELSAFHARQISSLNDEALTQKLTEVWGETRATDAQKRELIDRYKALLTPERLNTANPSAGRALFNKTCASCHVLYGQGKSAGPDLTGSNRKNHEYLLENIIDPNASVAVDFRMSVIALNTGRVISGLIVEKADKTLTVQTQNERVVVDRAEIDDMKMSNASLMPEGLLTNLTEEQFCDLAAYLMSSEQVPLPAP